MVLAAEGRKDNDSDADCYQYFCVPEYGTANGRLHFHAVHFMRTLPTGSVDPNFGRRVRNRRQFFFSSRRRHTSCLSDWSSDVCSSDLTRRAKTARSGTSLLTSIRAGCTSRPSKRRPRSRSHTTSCGAPCPTYLRAGTSPCSKIGRASCRGGV